MEQPANSRFMNPCRLQLNDSADLSRENSESRARYQMMVERVEDKAVRLLTGRGFQAGLGSRLMESGGLNVGQQ
jgi:hypothetical protein